MGRAIFSALLLSSVLSSTSWAFSPSDYSFQLSPVNRELTKPSVHTIYQDSQGFLWFLTTAGLNRHDGYTVTRFRSTRISGTSENSENSENSDSPRPTENSLTNQHTTGIAEDNTGNLWVSTKNGGLNRIDAASGKITA